MIGQIVLWQVALGIYFGEWGGCRCGVCGRGRGR